MWYRVLSITQNDENEVFAKVSTDEDSPWFAGHFPGDPVLPGIAQLHMVTACIEQAVQQKLIVQHLARVKFKQLIRPGDILDIHVTPGKKDNNYTFTIETTGRPVCSGRLVLRIKEEQ